MCAARRSLCSTLGLKHIRAESKQKIKRNYLVDFEGRLHQTEMLKDAFIFLKKLSARNLHKTQ
jgi:hypothetical protein